MLESLNYSFWYPKNIIWVIYRIKQLRNYKKNMGSSEDPSLVNNVEELGLVYYGLLSSLKDADRLGALDNLLFNVHMRLFFRE